MNRYAQAERITYAHIEQYGCGQYVLVNNRHSNEDRKLLLDPVVEGTDERDDELIVIYSAAVDDAHPDNDRLDHVVFGQLTINGQQSFTDPVYFRAEYNTHWFESFQRGRLSQKLALFDR